MKSEFNHHNSGFTIVELLVFVAINSLLPQQVTSIFWESALCEAEKSALNGGVTTGIVVYSVVGPPACPVNMLAFK